MADIEHGPTWKKNARVGSLERHDTQSAEKRTAGRLPGRDRAPRCPAGAFPPLGNSIPKCNQGSLSTVGHRAQSSRLAAFGGRRMSFNICRSTLASWQCRRSAHAGPKYGGIDLLPRPKVKSTMGFKKRRMESVR